MPNDVRIAEKLSAARARHWSRELFRDAARDLRIPSSISYKSALSVSMLTQAVITWGAHPADKALITDLNVHAANPRRTLGRNAALLTAVQLARRIETPDGIDITAACKAVGRDAAKNWCSDVPQLASGVEVGSDRTVIAVDHDPELRLPRGIYPRGPLDEGSRPFYTGRHRSDVHLIRGRHPLGHRVLGVNGQRPEAWADRYSATGNALGVVLFELLQNTDIHARTSVYGHPLTESVRLMHARGFAQHVDVLTASDPDNRPLMEFYARTNVANPGRDTMRFLVVSVMDSGPGLARTLLRRENITSPKTPDQELEHLLRALKMTSGGSTREPMRGLGLRRVQTFLSALGGFARIRTGRFELQRDFLRDPFTGPSERDSLWWGGVNAPQPIEKVTGTTFTLLIPVPPTASADLLWEAAADGS